MRLIKSMILSLSMYSKIPMPQIECDEEDGKYMMIFFPMVGCIIAAATIGWSLLCSQLVIPEVARITVLAALPLVVSGGFHMDGFMDTADARASYQSRERKLEILKDPNIGAFAVIRVVVYELLLLASFSVLQEQKWLIVFALCYCLSRILSGISVVTFRSARQEGMLFYTAKTAQRMTNLIVLSLELIGIVAVMILYEPIAGCVAVGAALLTFAYYGWMSRRTFGGITGDLAGWFVTVTELVCPLALAVANCILHSIK